MGNKLSRKKLKDWAIDTYGYQCMACKCRKDIQLDHILPVSKYRHLEFEKSNCQLLCGPSANACNQKKGNVYIDDLRPIRAKLWFKFKWTKRSLLLGLCYAVATPSAHQSIDTIILFIQSLLKSVNLSLIPIYEAFPLFMAELF